MKKHTAAITALFLITIAVLPTVVFAQVTGHYELLVEDLPFIGDVAPEGGLAGYLNAFFKFGLAIAVLLAVVLFVYNGVVYMTSDATGKKEESKKAFFGIIGGLILALSTVLILQQINPDLVNFKLFQTLRDVSDTVSTTPPAPPAPPPAPEAELAAREAFKALGIGINNPPCTGSSGSGCTNVVGLEVIRPFLGGIASDLGGCTAENWDAKRCPVTVTGGTEPGHKTHGPGKQIVDLRFGEKVSSWVTRNAQKCSKNHSLGPVWVIRNAQVYFLDESGGSARHWHVCMRRGDYCNEFVRVCQTVAGE